MEEAYPRYRMSSAQRQLMQAWNKQYPVTAWECTRYQRIKALQGGDNAVLRKACQTAG